MQHRKWLSNVTLSFMYELLTQSKIPNLLKNGTVDQPEIRRVMKFLQKDRHHFYVTRVREYLDMWIFMTICEVSAAEKCHVGHLRHILPAATVIHRLNTSSQ